MFMLATFTEDRVISRGCKFKWPAHKITKLGPLDFWLWAYLKSPVYRGYPATFAGTERCHSTHPQWHRIQRTALSCRHRNRPSDELVMMVVFTVNKCTVSRPFYPLPFCKFRFQSTPSPRNKESSARRLLNAPAVTPCAGKQGHRSEEVTTLTISQDLGASSRMA
ncbi:hypothetical protein CDAR_603801 [Caerostris darwini]|uniref:Uncharacterized protein n=1 Tax=Caerostris darwini TaxID=1538125 RepID=A0AAV4T6S6_9ARAC|nr:hypothetical protein CDAR_603801 [Caerostris darwini]